MKSIKPVKLMKDRNKEKISHSEDNSNNGQIGDKTKSTDIRENYGNEKLNGGRILTPLGQEKLKSIFTKIKKPLYNKHKSTNGISKSRTKPNINKSVGTQRKVQQKPQPQFEFILDKKTSAGKKLEKKFKSIKSEIELERTDVCNTKEGRPKTINKEDSEVNLKKPTISKSNNNKPTISKSNNNKPTISKSNNNKSIINKSNNEVLINDESRTELSLTEQSNPEKKKRPFAYTKPVSHDIKKDVTKEVKVEEIKNEKVLLKRARLETVKDINDVSFFERIGLVSYFNQKESGKLDEKIVKEEYLKNTKLLQRKNSLLYFLLESAKRNLEFAEMPEIKLQIDPRLKDELYECLDSKLLASYEIKIERQHEILTKMNVDPIIISMKLKVLNN